MAKRTFPAHDRAREILVWDLPLRLFHWFLVAAIALAFLSSEEGGPLSDWHIVSGWTAAVLIVFRIAWGFVGGEHARWSDFVRPSRLAAHIRDLAGFRPAPALGHNPVGALSVLALLALAALVVWSGVALGEAGEDLHEFLAWTLLALIALHVVAVVVMSLLSRENLVAAMISGRKPADRHPGAKDARRPSRYAVPFAALVLIGAAYAICSYDPLAFTPRSVDAYEQGDAAGRTNALRQGAEADRGGEHDDR
jgi:cytochrome b